MPTETIPYHGGDDVFDAVITRPEGAGPHPAVLVCPTWLGRDASMEAKAARLAELGYIGAAIDVYGIGRRGVDDASCDALMRPLVADPPRLRRRLAAAFAAVHGLAGVDRDRMGAIGFCFGGLCSILTARMGLPLRGVVSFHGLLKTDTSLNERVHARILVLHGQDDPRAPPADVGAFAETMKRIGAEWELHAYPRVVHAFTDDEVIPHRRLHDDDSYPLVVVRVVYHVGTMPRDRPDDGSRGHVRDECELLVRDCDGVRRLRVRVMSAAARCDRPAEGRIPASIGRLVRLLRLHERTHHPHDSHHHGPDGDDPVERHAGRRRGGALLRRDAQGDLLRADGEGRVLRPERRGQVGVLLT